jgi:two-component system phosphate regulon response regulator PhoB
MPAETVLVVDDEPEIRELVEYSLTGSGYKVITAADGEQALRTARAKSPGLIVLDLMLPGMDGLEVCKALKADPRTASIPIVMLTAKGDESDIVVGLELGADDYVTKPFSPRVLLARIKTVLRRKATASAPNADDAIRHRDLVIDPERHEVTVKKRPVELTYTEFAVLQLLAQRPGRVFTRYQIIDAVKGPDYPVTDRSVDVQIAGLRKKLGACGGYVETVRGVGYRFKD